jgi:hypothetical protein
VSQRGARGPLTTRACADYVGFTSEWIRTAIDEGVVVDGRVVKLEAETIVSGHRRTYRIHVEQFIDFLQQIGWKRLPMLPPSSN